MNIIKFTKNSSILSAFRVSVKNASQYHVMNHKGNWLGTFLDNFWMNKEKFTRVGFEPATSGLKVPTELSSPILAVSLFCQYICSAGTSQKSWNHILPFSQGSRPSYDTTWEEAVRGCAIKGYNFKIKFIILVMCSGDSWRQMLIHNGCQGLCSVLTSSRREYHLFFRSPCGIIFSENSEIISSH